MNGLELNKIAAAIIVAGLIAMIAATVSRTIFHPHGEEEQARGYKVDVPEDGSAPAKKEVEPIDLAALFANADVAKGESVARNCTSCHSFEKGGAHAVGPNLWNVMGHKKAYHGDYNYSKAFKELEGEWNYPNMVAFLNNPKKYVKGTKMTFRGLRKPEDIASLIAWMRTKADSAPDYPPAGTLVTLP